MNADLREAKIELIQWLTILEDSELIEKLMQLRTESQGDWWQDISEREKESIELGLNEAKDGKLRPNSEARKIYGKWL